MITKEPLTEYLPIQRKPESGQPIEDAPVVTQYEMHGVEDLGLLKMDFLGLRNLDVISDTLDLIEQARGVGVDIDNVRPRRRADLRAAAPGDTIGVFQLEGGPMRALMRSLAPDSFEDVAALVALYRPGPMAANMHNDYADRKNGRKPVEYFHPDAEELLGRHLRPDDLPGVGHAGGAEVRRLLAGRGRQPAQGMGKKIRELMAKERAEVRRRGARPPATAASSAIELFDIIEPFADYAFNKSHSVRLRPASPTRPPT